MICTLTVQSFLHVETVGGHLTNKGNTIVVFSQQLTSNFEKL